MESSSDLLQFAARLWTLDPVWLVTKVHKLEGIDLHDLADLDSYEVALTVLDALAW